MPVWMNSATHSLLRIGAGALFLQHGLQKTFGLLGGVPPTGGAVPLFSQFGAAGVMEIIGGTLLILGLFARPVAALLTLEMLAAYMMVHLPQGGWPAQNQGELALLYALIFAYFTAHGAGALSLDYALHAWGANDRRVRLLDRRQAILSA